MLTGGRVIAYLQHYITDPKTTVLIAGFQSEGTRGRQLLNGASEIKMYGKYYEVKARIEEMMSEHRGKFVVVQVPNITNIFYGRDVGYQIERIDLPDALQAISATKIRAEMKK